MLRNMKNNLMAPMLLFFVQLILPSVGAAEVSVESDAARVVWTSTESFELARVSIFGPGNVGMTRVFEQGEPWVLNLKTWDSPLVDGSYRWRLELTSPVLTDSEQEAMAEARTMGDLETLAWLKNSLGFSARVATGHLLREGGQWISTGGELRTKDQRIQDDLVVEGRACVGVDCIDDEPFESDTLRIKDDRPTLRFLDTSDGVTAPTTDWELTANGPSGGGESLSIKDLDQNTTPVTVEGGAPDHSLFVTSSGNLGIGTPTPATRLHLVDGQTPSLRLEQDTTGGFPAQIWDVAADDSGLFFRDVGAAVLIPFKIERDAPTTSFHMKQNGYVGLGTDSPETQLHLLGDSGVTQIFVDDQNPTAGQRVQFHLRNNGDPTFQMSDTSDGTSWFFAARGPSFSISKLFTGVNEFDLTESGDLRVHGGLTATRDLRLFDTPFGASWVLNSQDETFQISKAGTGQSELELDDGGNLDISGSLSAPGGVSIGSSTLVEQSGALNLVGDTGTTQLKIEETSAIVAQRVLLDLKNNGIPTVLLEDVSTSDGGWFFSVSGDQFVLSQIGSGRFEMELNGSGNMALRGGLTVCTDASVCNPISFFPDYVFASDYELMPLEDLSQFIADNGHLPKVPTASDVGEDGIDMTALQLQLLEKVEELTLYTLDQHETIGLQEATIERQGELIEMLAARLTELEAQLPGL